MLNSYLFTKCIIFTCTWHVPVTGTIALHYSGFFFPICYNYKQVVSHLVADRRGLIHAYRRTSLLHFTLMFLRSSRRWDISFWYCGKAFPLFMVTDWFPRFHLFPGTMMYSGNISMIFSAPYVSSYVYAEIWLMTPFHMNIHLIGSFS